MGSYQMVKKWLSCRESKVLGLGLATDELHMVT